MFPTAYQEILAQVEGIDPIAYGKSRNYKTGAVSRLSPYISRGVISTRMVFESVIRRGYPLHRVEQFVKELCWRDYFQRIGQSHTAELLDDAGRPQENIIHREMPSAILHAQTGIEAVDAGIRALYETGYMHNHMRMYVASMATNIARAHWQVPAQWMYYHLLDADFASNTCSWQWVCGVRSHKRYYANQENINTYFDSTQRGTFLDTSYEVLEQMPLPEILRTQEPFAASTQLPITPEPRIESGRPVFLYNAYNLDPAWHAGETGSRILLLEPSHFQRWPMSPKTLQFFLDLSKNIPELQIYTAAFTDLQNQVDGSPVVFKEHPLFRHYQGRVESRDWIVPQVDGYYPSFFQYWKKISRLF
jgi:deoxyribodipyrimidine photo-lyase